MFEGAEISTVLKEVNLNLSAPDLVGVVGDKGSGKSTLLSAIMKQEKILKGCMHVNGKIGYVSKDSFIFEGTVKDNICLGKEYDKARMEKALKVA